MAKLIISDKDFLSILNDLTLKSGYPPTIREMVIATPYSSTSSLRYRLKKLEKSGHVLLEAFTARTMRLSEIGFGIISPIQTPRPLLELAITRPMI